MIIPVYQQIGQSSHLLAQRVGEQHGEKATHTGTLDPMAEGVLVVLTGEDRFRKSDLSGGTKTYEFEMLWGVRTDSLDTLGLITDTQCSTENPEQKLVAVLQNFVGRQQQLMPSFSAKRVAGNSMFDLAKKGTATPEVKQAIEVYSLEHLQTYTASTETVHQTIQDKIEKVTGDFRQQQVLYGWKQYFETNTQQLFISKVRALTSKRTYIRGLVRDIAQKLDLPGTTFSITRSENSGFTTADCQQFLAE